MNFTGCIPELVDKKIILEVTGLWLSIIIVPIATEDVTITIQVYVSVDRKLLSVCQPESTGNTSHKGQWNNVTVSLQMQPYKHARCLGDAKGDLCWYVSFMPRSVHMIYARLEPNLTVIGLWDPSAKKIGHFIKCRVIVTNSKKKSLTPHNSKLDFCPASNSLLLHISYIDQWEHRKLCMCSNHGCRQTEVVPWELWDGEKLN